MDERVGPDPGSPLNAIGAQPAREPAVSFVERFRGTRWDSTPAPPPSPTAEQRRRERLMRLLLATGVGLILLALGGGALLALRGQPPTGLDAFLLETPRGTAPSSTPASAPPPSVVSGTIPSVQQPWRADKRHPATRFVERMSAPDVTYHVDARVEIRLGGEGSLAVAPEVKVLYGADVAGSDYTLSLTRWRPTGLTRLQAVVKDGVAFLRLDGIWSRGSGDARPGHVLGAIAVESYAAIEYVGPEEVDGRQLHHLRLPVRGWPYPVQLALGDLLAPDSIVLLDVWLARDGRPHSAQASSSVTVGAGERVVPLQVLFAYNFSRVGQRITVDVPPLGGE